jgi:uncharacterized membrane protein YedE/YeeE
VNHVLAALFTGFVFAIGLGVAGMTEPENVLGFLRLEDPGLMLTMAGAMAMTLIGYPLILRRDRPLLGARFFLPTRRDLDPHLLVGAALFGLGWGLVGLCPGPALTGLAGGSPSVLLFVAAMFAGMFAHHRLFERK